MSEIRTIRIPQLGVNDQSARVVAWLVKDGGHCEKNDAVCAIETTKAAIEIPAERAGIVLHIVREGKDVEIGQTIGLIGDSFAVLLDERDKHIKKAEPGIKATDKAKTLAESLGVDLAQIQTKGIVREADVVKFHQLSDKTPIIANPSGLVVYGAGRGGANVTETVHRWTTCFVDDNPTDTELDGIPVYSSSRLPTLYGVGCRKIFIAIANGRKRFKLFMQLNELGWEVVNIIHPDTFIANSVIIGDGNHVKSGAIIDSNTVIGNCCIIDNNVAIPHDVTIGNGVHIAPGATLGSSITVGDYAIIGIGASIATGIKIGEGAIVGVGSAVMNDVRAGDYVEGVPARVIGHKEQRHEQAKG